MILTVEQNTTKLAKARRKSGSRKSVLHKTEKKINYSPQSYSSITVSFGSDFVHTVSIIKNIVLYEMKQKKLGLGEVWFYFLNLGISFIPQLCSAFWDKEGDLSCLVIKYSLESRRTAFWQTNPKVKWQCNVISVMLLWYSLKCSWAICMVYWK